MPVLKGFMLRLGRITLTPRHCHWLSNSYFEKCQKKCVLYTSTVRLRKHGSTPSVGCVHGSHQYAFPAKGRRIKTNSSSTYHPSSLPSPHSELETSEEESHGDHRGAPLLLLRHPPNPNPHPLPAAPPPRPPPPLPPPPLPRRLPVPTGPSPPSPPRLSVRRAQRILLRWGVRLRPLHHRRRERRRAGLALRLHPLRRPRRHLRDALRHHSHRRSRRPRGHVSGLFSCSPAPMVRLSAGMFGWVVRC